MTRYLVNMVCYLLLVGISIAAVAYGSQDRLVIKGTIDLDAEAIYV